MKQPEKQEKPKPTKAFKQVHSNPLQPKLKGCPACEVPPTRSQTAP